jgi:large-conductance mechanosensitive channel
MKERDKTVSASAKPTIIVSDDVQVESAKRTKRHGVTVLLEPDDLVREQVGGFANFLRGYAVVGLAIGFIIGQEANTVVKQFVASFIQPWLQVIFGSKLSNKVAILHHGSAPVQFSWGAFLYSLIEFFFVVLSVYIAIKLFRLDKLKKK